MFNGRWGKWLKSFLPKKPILRNILETFPPRMIAKIDIAVTIHVFRPGTVPVNLE